MVLISVSDTSQEYEEGESAEAILVKDLDRFDMIFQAFEYEKCKNPNGNVVNTHHNYDFI